MLRFVILLGIVLGCFTFSRSAYASADGSCYPEWSLYSRDRDCSSSAVIAPGNDTRANLLLLLIVLLLLPAMLLSKTMVQQQLLATNNWVL